MKNTVLILVLLISFISLKAQEQLLIDVDKSKINWSCDYVFYFNGHNGTISFEKGHFIKSNEKISGGEFVIDMNSIICLDLEDEESNLGLVEHLKDPDFFNVPEFPRSKLKITNVKYHNDTELEIWADLEIKNIVQPIKFQAKVNYDTKIMTAKFKIDRTRWGVTYNSDIKDGAISDAIGFEVNLAL